MEISMRNIPFTADEVKVTLQLAPILHSSVFQKNFSSPGLPINFKVFLWKNKRNPRHGHSGRGTLVLPSESIGITFLQYVASHGFTVDHRSIHCERSPNSPRRDILGEIQLLPYRDPRDIQAKEARLADLSGQVRLQDVQFGWICRDESFSVEWQWNPWHMEMGHHSLYFNDDTREILVQRRLGIEIGSEIFIISMRYSRIQSIEANSSDEPSLLLTLESPPSYEKTIDFPFLNMRRQKLTSLNAEHKRVAPFTWNALRLVCGSRSGLAEFKRMADVAGLKVYDRQYPVVRRRLFGAEILQRKEEWLGGSDLPWNVAFQCEALHRDMLLDTAELLDLRSGIDDLVATHGEAHAEQVLRQLALRLRSIWLHEDDETVSSCFNRIKTEILQDGISPLNIVKDNRTFRCLHINFTPTTMTLRGPFPDMTNRILRRYATHQGCFLRVSFTDEDLLKFRFNHREVDGPGFINMRVGNILREGFRLCGRHFQFLAYSQSALKQYAMWFVTPFKDHRGLVDAEIIRSSIGSEWPEGVRRCPARFAARLSQAFTATEPSVFIEPDQVERIPDIERNGYCFSDGNGVLTQDMASAIHDALQRGTGRAYRVKRAPSVFQVRIQGAKGTLSIDSQLSGMRMGLRPSMVKFETRDSPEIEVARSFNKPGRLFLNRPLVMILNGLGVDAQEFLKLQQDAVEETETSSKSMKSASHLLEAHGLGTAFALPSTFTNLYKLGLDWKQVGRENSYHIRDMFMERSMQYAVNHVLREMKYRCRIPVPMSWKLVGVVDVHSILEPQEVYACIKRGEDTTPEYLRGLVVISKSPTIHPGDIQIAKAIGKPPDNSPLRGLTNCVVFSQRGDRPLPNKLSGSDLDGDEYDLILLPSLRPPRIASPGEYPPAPRKRLERDSTIYDVAEFVVDFINNDMLGIIAINFLLIADRRGIFHKDCLTLAELHNWAVDFPKSGVPVPHDKIPQPEIRIKPDWFASEVTFRQEGEHYESQSVLGKLFRAIHLPKLSGTSLESRAQRRRKKDINISLEEAIEQLSLDSGFFDDPISVKLRRRIRPLVDLKASEGTPDSIIKLFDHYATELDYICVSRTLSRKPTSRLTEEEVLIGTIVAKSSQPRMRTDMISGIREETTALVRQVRKELEGGEDSTTSEWINRAWTAWQVSVTKSSLFGAKSFGWIALRALFDGIKFLEGEN